MSLGYIAKQKAVLNFSTLELMRAHRGAHLKVAIVALADLNIKRVVVECWSHPLIGIQVLYCKGINYWYSKKKKFFGFNHNENTTKTEG